MRCARDTHDLSLATHPIQCNPSSLRSRHVEIQQARYLRCVCPTWPGIQPASISGIRHDASMFQDGSLQMLCTTTFILTAHAAQPDICLCLCLCPRKRNRCANSVPFITVKRLLKTWVSGCFSQNPHPGPSSYQTSRFASLGRLNTTPRVASPGQTLRQSQVHYKTGQFTSHAAVLSVLALYSKQQHADICWPIGPLARLST